MTINIIIIFDKNPPAYMPGEVVSGRILIQSDKPVSSKGLKFKSSGLAYVYWEERKTVYETNSDGKRVSKTVKEHYTQTERYYNNEFNIWGNGNNQELPTDQFVFQFQLPENIPASFEGKYGYVRHRCSVKLKSSSFFKFSKKKTVNLSVNPLYDLNTDPTAMRPLTGEKQKNFCCWCCATGPISFTIRIGQSGYVCGQSICINAECTNASTRKINHTDATLNQIIKYRARSKTKSEVHSIANLRRGEIVAGDSDVWLENMIIPPLPASNLSHCSIIDISYKLTFSMDATCAPDLDESWPIIIGTIPLQQNFTSIEAFPEIEPTAPPMNDQPPPYANLYNDCPPPTYEESKKMAGIDKNGDSSSDDDEDNGSAVRPFAPLYPSYNFTYNRT